LTHNYQEFHREVEYIKEERIHERLIFLSFFDVSDFAAKRFSALGSDPAYE
jgi:hypothetical protein